MKNGSATFSVVCGGDFACDWDAKRKVWCMTELGSSRWECLGDMSELGRRRVISHFKLEGIENRLPLQRIAKMSPAVLQGKRRVIEDRAREAEHFIAISQCPGQHVPATVFA